MSGSVQQTTLDSDRQQRSDTLKPVSTTKSKLTTLSATLLCATIITTVLFSGTEGGNTFNFAVTALFISVAAFTALLEKPPFKFYPEIVILIAWLCYAMLPSATAIALDSAAIRTQQMVQIVVLTLFATNVIAWHGRTEIFLIAYVGAAVTAYFASLSGFGFGIIDASVLQELNSSDRIVGTHSNANDFGRLLVHAQLASLLLAVKLKSTAARLVLACAFVALAIAVLHTGSRTALVGMLVLIAGLVWAFKLWRPLSLIRAAFILAAVGIISVGAATVLKDNEIVAKRVESFLGNEYLMGRYRNLLRLTTSLGDVETIDTSSESSASHRAELIRNAWGVAKQHPFGLGLDNFEVEFGAYAHSNHFEILATTGFPGLALFLGIYFYMLRRSFVLTRQLRRSDILARVFALCIVTLLVMDLAAVSYYLKHYWLVMALGITTMELHGRSLTSRQHTSPAASPLMRRRMPLAH